MYEIWKDVLKACKSLAFRKIVTEKEVFVKRWKENLVPNLLRARNVFLLV